jgi:purine catabolism regulator
VAVLAERLDDQIAASAHSSRYRQAIDARAALEEAELLLKLVEAGGRSSSGRPTWDSLRLLFRAFVADPQELARFAEQTVGAVVRHDERHGSELEITFWAYQENNCNMNLTAKATFTHRHTISNRLTRIEELTGLDPVRNYDRELLSLAFKAHVRLREPVPDPV